VVWSSTSPRTGTSNGYFWFGETFGGGIELWPFDDGCPGADLRVEGSECAGGIGYPRPLRPARAACGQVIAEYELGDVRVPGRGSEGSLSQVLIHMVGERARYAAHVDFLREFGDDAVGDRPGFAVDEP
jgi:hypothetical protein